MPHSAPPHCLDTVPEKGASHSELTRNKAECGIQAMQSIRMALVCKVQVTTRYVLHFPFQKIVSEKAFANKPTGLTE
jgi:hypothetical protein